MRKLKLTDWTAANNALIQHFEGTQAKLIKHVKLGRTTIKDRDIGHDWQFTKEQQLQLQRYYKASQFLVNLMQIQGAVSEKCQTEIEDGMLLPWAELQLRQPHLYGEPDEF